MVHSPCINRKKKKYQFSVPLIEILCTEADHMHREMDKKICTHSDTIYMTNKQAAASWQGKSMTTPLIDSIVSFSVFGS